MHTHLLLPLLLCASVARSGPCPIEVVKEGWGEASPADIHAVLASAQHEIWKHCEGLQVAGVQVVHHAHHPIAFDQRLPDGRVRIGLATGDLFWCQYAFQYSHEFAHLITGHTRPEGAWVGTGNATGWLEESLCETASLFALRAMARTWRETPPYPNWRGYATALEDYARERLTDPKHQLPPGAPFEKWLESRLPDLRRESCNRELNTIVAIRILPVFEKDPAAWKALAWLRHSKAGSNASLGEHLSGWRDACPEDLRPHVDRIAWALQASP